MNKYVKRKRQEFDPFPLLCNTNTSTFVNILESDAQNLRVVLQRTFKQASRDRDRERGSEELKD
jgi:hypothetical protein